MHIIRVIPLTKMPANAPAVLDYFWPTPLLRGSLVRATMGRRPISALVIDVLDVRSAKLTVKKSAFALRKIDSVITDTPQVTDAQISLARWMSTHYAVSLATCLKTVCPPFLGKRGKLLTLSNAPVARDPSTHSAGRLVLTQPDTALKEIRRIAASTKSQILILVPEITLIDQLCRDLSPLKPHAVYSGLAARGFEQVYRGVLDGSVRVVIGTRSALFLPWSDLGAVIVEDPLNEAYKSDMTPRYNAPDTARALASSTGASLT